MDIIEFFCSEQKRLHAWMQEAVGDLTIEEWNTVPAGNGNSIAFLFWHAVRTEDNILRFILQGRPTIWNEGNWHERLSLPLRAQGTGMPTEEAQGFHVDDPDLLLAYARQVWHEFETYLAAITDGGAELSARKLMVKPLGEMPAIQVVGQVCITHLFSHYGEIALIRGQFNKRGMPI